MEWWQSFFDASYLEIWSHLHPQDLCEAEADALMQLLDLQAGDTLLDAPCGYGRIAVPLANRGLKVTGVDFSSTMLRAAKARAEQASPAHAIKFLEADLRKIQLKPRFNAAINLFSSIGYGSEDDDLVTFRTIHNSLLPGGRFLVETMHRDAIITRRALGDRVGVRGPNGMTLREHNVFDPISGQMHSTWTWNSPTQAGQKSSVMRLYCATELVSLLTRAGFAKIVCRTGITNEAFSEETLGSRLSLLCYKAG